MYNYFTKKGSITPAMKRAIIESELIEAFHWLPQDIKKIPYRDLQEYYIIQRQKNETAHQRQALDAQKQESANKTHGSGRGQMKRAINVTSYKP